MPRAERGRAGFNILAGGKMGSGGFTIAQPLDVFVEPAEAAEATAELVRIFRDHGPREARSKCRLAHLIEDWGIAELRYVLCERLMRELDRAGEDMRQRGPVTRIIWGCSRKSRGISSQWASPWSRDGRPPVRSPNWRACRMCTARAVCA